MTHCAHCGGEFKHMTKTEVTSFEGGSLSVSDIPIKVCACETIMNLSDGALVDGYKMLLQSNGIIGKVEVSLGKLKDRYPNPMDLILPHVQSR